LAPDNAILLSSTIQVQKVCDLPAIDNLGTPENASMTVQSFYKVQITWAAPSICRVERQWTRFLIESRRSS
jgi:hypothetical protein